MRGPASRHATWIAGAAVLVVLASIPAPAQTPTGTIRIFKFDIETRHDDDPTPTPGARFELYTNAEPLDPPRGPEDLPTGLSCVVDSNGNCRIDAPLGRYWAVETKPPDGYDGGAEFRANLNVVTPNWRERVGNDLVEENVRVNDPTGDTAAGDGTHTWQFGASIAADLRGNRILTVFDDTTHFDDGGSVSGAGFAYSLDGGVTWIDGGEVPAGNALINGDSSLMFDPLTGAWVAVFSACFRDASNQVRCPPAVMRTEFGVAQDPTFTGPVFVDQNMPVFPAFGHSPVILVDTNPRSPFAGRLYVIWTRSNADATSQIMLSFTDEFLGEFTTVPISPVGHFDFPDASVAPDGTLHVIWADFVSSEAPTFGIFWAKSTDGGATFTNEVAAGQNVPKSGTPGTCDGQPARLLDGGIRAIDQPQVEVNPQNQRQLVTVYTAQGVQAGDSSDIFVQVSNDGGLTWSDREVVPPFDGEQMAPSFVLSDLGVAELLAYANELAEEANGVDLFLGSFAMVDGPIGFINFLESQRVNAVPSGIPPQDPPSDTSGVPCNSLGSTGLAEGPSVFAAWTDGRDPGPPASNGIDPNIYFAHVQTPRVPTTTTVDVDKTRTRLEVSGELNPSVAGDALTVTLFRDDGDGFDRVGRRRVEVNARHRYATSFDRPDGDRCRVVVKFAGSPEQQKSSARQTFAC